MAQRGIQMLAHPALGLVRVFGGDRGGDRAVRLGGFVAVVLSDVLFGRGPAHRLFDGGQNGSEKRVSAGLHQQLVEFVVAGAVGRDAALCDSGDALALFGRGVFGDVAPPRRARASCGKPVGLPRSLR